MVNPKLRKLLVTLHLLLAAFLTPAFFLVAITGGNYLLGNKGSTEEIALTLPAGTTLDLASNTLEADVRALIQNANIDHDFEYIKRRGDYVITRPTSRPYLKMQPAPDGLKAFMVKPSAQNAMMELHMGHGPRLFRHYQKLVALGLILVVLGGFLVGLLSPAYRRRTVITTALGIVIFIGLAFIV